MNSRRQFLKQAGTVGAGVAAAATSAASLAASHTAAPMTAYQGPHKMPQNAKLLSIRNADGTETLGAVTAGGVVDIRATAKKLGIAAPLTLQDLLGSGNADALAKVVAGAKNSGVPLLAEADITHCRLFTNPSKIM